MSLGTVRAIILRMKSATEKSPLAVFRTPENITDQLECVFASTAMSQLRIRTDKKNLVGVFDNSIDEVSLRRVLERNLTKAAVA